MNKYNLVNVRSTVTRHRKDTRTVTSNIISYAAKQYSLAFVLSVFIGGLPYVY